MSIRIKNLLVMECPTLLQGFLVLCTSLPTLHYSETLMYPKSELSRLCQYALVSHSTSLPYLAY